jgi:phosphoribosylamine--glycine ligase
MRPTERPTKILGIDKSGRLDCALEAFSLSSRPKELYVLSEVKNPGLYSKSSGRIRIGKTDNVEDVITYAKEIHPDFVFIGPEEPLASGIVDELAKIGIPAVGPIKELAKLETSKRFTRELLHEFRIPGNPKYRTFTRTDDLSVLRRYLQEQKSFVIKPDGLTGGKGVKVFGEHLRNVTEAVDYCEEIFKGGQEDLLVEERLEGEEFSFQSFCDGRNVVDTIPVQDHKRAKDGDLGPNTGGMGSYSCEDHLLPFLKQGHLEQASHVNRLVAQALLKKTGKPYKGILYGSFMLTRDGLRVIEYNARFGDPEIMNVLPLLETDFIDICEAIIAGNLDKLNISFSRKATVCKYTVPDGYPTHPMNGAEIDLTSVSRSSHQMRLYYAAVDDTKGGLRLTGSRAIAIVGIGANLAEAEKIAEAESCKIRGPVFHRSDIGTAKLIARRVAHIDQLCSDSRPLTSQTHA